MNTITVISVAYNSASVLPSMAQSLPDDVALIIVDNGPDDGLRDWARIRSITLLTPGENLGFGPACNLGAAEATSEFVLFLNPDARLEPMTLPTLLAAATQFPAASAFGPVFRSPDGTSQFKRRSYLNRSQTAPRDPGPDPVVVPCLSGAALMVRSAAFQNVGGFDPAIFLYYEDDDLTLRLQSLCGPLVLVPGAVVQHFSGQSSAPSPNLSRFKGYHWARSRIHVGRKYGLRLVWLYALKNAVWQLLRPRSWTSPDRRAEGWGRLAGVLSRIRG
jgi:N-acetylglucosaminyl-diphospho-decaprenol L-rhamnosyltransferase